MVSRNCRNLEDSRLRMRLVGLWCSYRQQNDGEI
jgi:hypothetical protein